MGAGALHAGIERQRPAVELAGAGFEPGQQGLADAFGERKFSGTVIRVGEILGRKKIKTEEPTEKVDTKVLEVLVQLEPGTPLKPGLRMDTFIESDSSSTTLK